MSERDFNHVTIIGGGVMGSDIALVILYENFISEL